MAWRVPQFGIAHALRDRGYANVSHKNPINTGDYRSFFFDERREQAWFSGVDNDHHIQVDLGSGTPATFDRIVVPVGHNYSGRDLRIRESAASDMSSPTTLYGPTAVASAAQIDEDFDQESVLRYIRVDWNAASFNPATPELWLTKVLAPGQSAEPTWRDERFYNVQTFITPAGDRGDLQLGASQRVFELEFPKIDAAADIAMLDQLVDDVGMEQAFLFWLPFDDEEVLICKMLRPPERRFASAVPSGGVKAYTYRFSIIEQLV